MATIIAKLWNNKASTGLMISSICVLIALLVGWSKAKSLSDKPDSKGNVQVNPDTKKRLVETYVFSMVIIGLYILFSIFAILRS